MSKLSAAQKKTLIATLKGRFEKHPERHKGIDWAKVQAKLEASADKLWSLYEMEATGGEPDVIGHDKKSGEYIFVDCAAESRRGAAASATTARHRMVARNIRRRTTRSTWPRSWASRS